MSGIIRTRMTFSHLNCKCSGKLSITNTFAPTEKLLKSLKG